MADNKPPITNEEENYGLPENWVPVDAPPIVPALLAPTTADGSSKYLQGSLPPSFQHDASFVGTSYRQERTPQLSLMPLGIQGNAATNAAVQSTAAQTPSQVPSTIAGPPVSVSLAIPSIFTPVTQTGVESAQGLVALAFSLAAESPHFFLAGPVPSAALYVDADNVASTSSAVISTTATPSQGGTDFAMVFTAQDGTAGETLFAPGAGWTNQFTAGTSTAFSQQLSGFNSVTASSTISISSSWTSILVLFGSNGSSTVSHATTLNSGNFGSGSGTPANNTAGNTLILVRYSTVLFGTVPTISAVTDSQGNAWFPVISTAGNLSGSGTALAVWIAPNVIGGANTITWTQTGGNTSGNMEYFEVSNLTAFPGIPTFRLISGSDLPLPTTTSLGAVFAKGLVGSQFFTSLGTDGRFTSAQPGFADISGNIAVTQMNSGTNADAMHFFRGDNTWARLGSASSVDSTGNFANIGSTVFPALSPQQTGVYRISVYCIVAQAASGSSTLPDCLISWTDGSNTTTQTIDFVAAAPTGNSLTTYFQGSVVIHINVLHTSLSYQTGSVTSYTSVGGVPMKYDLFLRVEAL